MFSCSHLIKPASCKVKGSDMSQHHLKGGDEPWTMRSAEAKRLDQVMGAANVTAATQTELNTCFHVSNVHKLLFQTFLLLHVSVSFFSSQDAAPASLKGSKSENNHTDFRDKARSSGQLAKSKEDGTQRTSPEQVIMLAGRHQALIRQLDQEKIQNIWSDMVKIQ